MIAQRNYVQAWIVGIVVSSSLTAGEKPIPSAWEACFASLAVVFNVIKKNGLIHETTTIVVDDKKERHRTVSSVVITSAITSAVAVATGLAIWEVRTPVINLLYEYLPNVWPFVEIKEQARLKKEEEEDDKIIASAERQRKRVVAQGLLEAAKKNEQEQKITTQNH